MLLDFLNQYFIQPIRVESGYNLINTTVYAVVALVLLYGIYRLLRYFKFNIDIKFFIAMIPFVVLGSSIRAFVDHNYIARGFWWVSPGIWMFIAVIFLITLLISHLISKENYWKISLIAGSIYSIIAFSLVFDKIALTNFVGAVVILTLFAAAAIALFSIGGTFKQEWITDNMHFTAIAGHLFDATNTFVIIDFFGGVEKHPIPRFVIEHFGTGLAFYPLKLLVLLPAIYLIYTELKDRKQLRNFLLISIAVLGFAEGLRNFITLILA